MQTITNDTIEQVNTLLSSTPDAVLGEITSIGRNSIDSARSIQSTLNTRLSAFAGDGGQLVQKMQTLQEKANELREIDPSKPAGWLDKIMGLIGKGNVDLRIRNAFSQYESIRTCLGNVVEALITSKPKIEANQEGLGILKAVIERQNKLIDKETEAAEYALKNLSKAQLDESGIELATTHLNSTLVDLKTLKVVNGQFIATINQTMMSLADQIRAVERASNITVTVATIGFIIRSALENSKKIGEVIDASSEFLSEMMVDNAKMLDRQVNAINADKHRPMVKISSLEEARSILEQAIETAATNASDANDNMRDVIDRLNKLDGVFVGMEAKTPITNNSAVHDDYEETTL